MHPDPARGTIIYRSGMNPKIRRNFEIFTPCDFIAAITQHIPDKNFQLVRYYGWYSNKMRGQRLKRTAMEERAGEPPGNGIEIIDVSEHRPRRPPSPKWRELIKKVWEADPLICPTCSREMRIVSLIDEREVIERILRHLGLWTEGVRLNPARAPPDGEREGVGIVPRRSLPRLQQGACDGLRPLRGCMSLRGRGGLCRTGLFCLSGQVLSSPGHAPERKAPNLDKNPALQYSLTP